MPLYTEERVRLDNSTVAESYSGTPLPASFTIADRIDFYQSENKREWLRSRARKAFDSGDDMDALDLMRHVVELKL